MNEIGNRYGRITVTGTSKRSGYVSCKCDCGKELDVRLDSLRRGCTRSCGCLRSETSRNSSQKNFQKIVSLFANAERQFRL